MIFSSTELAPSEQEGKLIPVFFERVLSKVVTLTLLNRHEQSNLVILQSLCRTMTRSSCLAYP